MRILHGSWLAKYSGDKGAFMLWAESSEAHPDSGARQHPYALPTKDLRSLLNEITPSSKLIDRYRFSEATICLWLPSTRRAPLPSNAILRDDNAPIPKKPILTKWYADGLSLPPSASLILLANLPSDLELPFAAKIGPDLHYWQTAAKFALEILTRQRLKPSLQKHRNQFIARWEPLINEPHEQVRMERLVLGMPPVCRAISLDPLAAKPDPNSPQDLLNDFLSKTIDGFTRDYMTVGRVILTKTVAEQWLHALQDEEPIIEGSSANLAAFYEQYHAWADPIDGTSDDTFRICFRLDPPETSKAEGIHVPNINSREWLLRYFLQANDDPSLLVPADSVWSEQCGVLKYLNRKFEAPQERLLAGLGFAAKIFSPIETSLHTALPASCTLNVEQAYTFIRETALLLQSSGFGVLLPAVSNKISVHLKLKSSARKSSPQQKGGVGSLSFESIVEYDWRLAIGGESLSHEELIRLASLKTPLLQVRGQWVEIRPDQIEQAIKFWDKRKNAGEMPLQDALRLALSHESMTTETGLPVTEVVAEDWIAELLKPLVSGKKLMTISAPSSFRGTLRHYQLAGLSWLAFLRQWRLGACLADDMGLGKTPTTIALLLHDHAQLGNHKPTLIICPTSVVSNWQRELSRFGPDLRVHVHHGSNRKKSDFASAAQKYDVILSSYALLHRDLNELTQVEWSDVILDEAQNIKNPTTKQAQAARQIGAKAEWRAALTGTPVENRLTEIWSIFQFLNPNYLGSQNDFYTHFAKPIESINDAAAMKRLKSLVSPFILRRLKTDSNVIADLPQKNEMKVFCNLTKEQATLYQAVVSDSMKRIEDSVGIERRGVVLATLIKLKQVCNHPAQFLGDGSTIAGRSGKVARLTEMLEEVRAVHDRALIFTQFVEMGNILKTYLQDIFNEEVLFLNGSVVAQARTKMIDRFQNEPNGPSIFILSIKAGGTGLNLMRANHIFHFDRWWNPAVENQATDRAYRIGKTKNVQVHKYICAGTFEEKIDAIIERKQALSESIVGASEAWISEMTTDQLRELFVLRREVIMDN